MIRKLFFAGVDAFRLNFSHGNHEDHGLRVKAIREMEQETGRPVCIIADLQGPKLRIGRFVEHKVHLRAGQRFRLDLDTTLGDSNRVELPHPEILSVLMPGHDVLLDDGKVRLRVVTRGEGWLETEVIAGTYLSDHKGFNIPGVLVPLPPLTPKDKIDLAYALTQSVDWIALSFVQLPSDLDEPRKIVGDKALIMVKVEKPSAVAHLDEIVAAADGLMVARGDLGVEMPLEEVPGIQKRMVLSFALYLLRGIFLIFILCFRLDPNGSRCRQAHHRRHPDVGVDDQRTDADSCRSLGCGNGCV
jgi:pyruvate kinase